MTASNVTKKNLADKEFTKGIITLDAMPLFRRLVCANIENRVAPWAARHVVPTFHGNEDEAEQLAGALPNNQRGEVAVALWQASIPVRAYRVFLTAAWLHDHYQVIKAAVTRRRLQAMFRYAEFDTSGHPDAIRVWRGTSGIDFKTAASGYSWTMDRDMACWFAMRFANLQKSPLVLMADVRRDMIACNFNQRDESEIVLLSPPAARVDGTPEEWGERCYGNRTHRQRQP